MTTAMICTLANGNAVDCTMSDANFATTGMVFFLFAIFCAYWAQTSGRGSWRWFFAGLFFAPITGLVLLQKNADDKKKSRDE